ncbi:MAG: leucine--tRNA ligase [Candidatus Woesebacteria bacterium]|jgi:leucyl-tRNA synthetase
MKKQSYDHQQIEEKWQKIWEKQQLFQNSLAPSKSKSKQAKQAKASSPSSPRASKTSTTPQDKEKMYLLFAFAYPSGSGLHVGHVESKTALDILARYYRMQGKEVFFPVGWDAFGLPAENYAIKTGTPPAVTTKEAINTFRRQIKRLGISYDWVNEIATCHPEYYKWTQWIFLQLYKKGLAYQDKGMVNWCPSCQTVLANEQVVEGLCERCDSQVEQKDLKQWYFKITQYKDELLSGLNQVDWPEATKQHQRNWIGKKQGIDIDYQVEGKKDIITCFTTRPDTNFGATFIVLAPEHEFSQKVAKKNAEIKAYIEKSTKKTELERQQEGRKKTGIFTGFYAINNLNGKRMPIWISDFVLGGFGTGAVVGVPGHDKRDFEFAQAFDLEVIRVVLGPDGDDAPITKIEQVQEEEGKMVNSEFLNGLDIHEAIRKVMDYLEKKAWGRRVTSYKLRDWLISRQRYWGAPIPIVYDSKGKPHPVKEEHLPWMLATDVDFKPTGESPLKSSKEFIQRTEKLYGKGWRPEFDTMDTFVDSSWYFLRYLGSRDKKEFSNKANLDKWLPIDLYLIGPEHIVLHLLYSRFFTKFLRDEGYLKIDEPFAKMRHQGMILGPDGKKMSKSKGNVINPDEVIAEYGADTLRVYEMFMGPLEADKAWDTSSVRGVRRFLDKVYKLVESWQAVQKQGKVVQTEQTDQEMVAKIPVLKRKLHQTIKKVGNDIPRLKFNTAIAAMMEFINEWSRGEINLGQEDVKAFVRILAPFAAFLAEELWAMIANEKTASVHLAAWPAYDQNLAKSDTMTIVVQVNGKIRGELEIEEAKKSQKSEIIAAAKNLASVKKWLQGKEIKKEIYVEARIVSLVVN